MITDADTTRIQYVNTTANTEQNTALADLNRQRNERVRKQFEAGYADRVELAGAELESAAALRLVTSLRLETQRTLGQLEDALQVPLIGGPQPDPSADELAHR